MKVFKYGARTPTVGLEVVVEQLRLASRYRNRLIELELARRACRHFGIPDPEIKLVRAEESKRLRAESGLSWGTYQLIEQDLQRAMRTATPRFRAHRGTGRLGASVQSCTELQVEQLFRDKGPVRLTGTIGKVVCTIRFGRDGLVEIPVKLHRPLPAGTKVNRVVLTVDRIGGRWVYSLQFTVDAPSQSMVRGSGSVAINFGWRRVAGGVRVAMATGPHGTHELVLPERIIGRFRHAEGLRALADKVAHEFLGDSRRRTRARREALAAPVLDPAIARERFDPATARRDDLADREHWARRDRHLYQWECDERAGALRARAEVYRLWVRMLASIYGEVIIEDFDIGRLIRRDSNMEVPEARHYAFLVAPATLRNEVKTVFGGAAKLVKSPNLTVTCASCRKKCKWDRVREVRHTCEHCGAEWDQDENNAANLAAAVAAE